MKGRRLRAGDRFEFYEGDRGVHVITRVTPCAAYFRPERGEVRTYEIRNRTVHKNGLTYKVPLEEPKEITRESVPEAKAISPFAMVRLLPPREVEVETETETIPKEEGAA